MTKHLRSIRAGMRRIKNNKEEDRMGFFDDFKEDLSQAVDELNIEAGKDEAKEEDLSSLSEMIEKQTEEVINKDPEQLSLDLTGLEAEEPVLDEEGEDVETPVFDFKGAEEPAPVEEEIPVSLEEEIPIPEEEPAPVEEEIPVSLEEEIPVSEEEPAPIEEEIPVSEEEPAPIEEEIPVPVEDEIPAEEEAPLPEEEIKLPGEELLSAIESVAADVIGPETSGTDAGVMDNITNDKEIGEMKDEKNKELEIPELSDGPESDENGSVTAGMSINGDITSEGSLDVVGVVKGNINVRGKLNVSGSIIGNSKASEVFADSAKITGEVISTGAVKVGQESVIIGNITATSAVIAGAVKGDIDVRGPVILDTSAIVMGDIKSKSVQINNGAVVEGHCSQCYAEVSPTSFFDELKSAIESKKGSK